MSKEINFGTLGFVTQQQFGPLKELCDALFKVSGLKCEYGTLYQNKTVNDSKAVWWLEFDSIAAFNRFLWAGCRRYFTISNNPNWMLVADCGDPDYDNTTIIKMTLEYKKVKASVEEVNYPSLKGAASRFNDKTCSTVSRSVVAISPQA